MRSGCASFSAERCRRESISFPTAACTLQQLIRRATSKRPSAAWILFSPACSRRQCYDCGIMKPIARHMEERGIDIGQLVTATGLAAKLVKAIVSGNYVPGPSQRQQLAAALSVSIEDISWDHAVPVQHLRGNGPQCGRPT